MQNASVKKYSVKKVGRINTLLDALAKTCLQKQTIRGQRDTERLELRNFRTATQGPGEQILLVM